MKLESAFQISVYLLTALAGAMLAYAEESPFPAGITVILSCFALLFNEHNRRLHLTTLISNLLGLVVLAVVYWESHGPRADALLVAGTHFLVYTTWIVLFQTRDVRHYWWLFALSLLQVAVGPLLTLSSGLYGILLIIYLLLAIWTLSVFTLYQGAIEFGELPDESERQRPRRAGWRRVGGAGLVRAKAADDSLTAAQELFAANRRSAVRSSIQQDSPGRWITPRFIIGTLTLAFAGQALGMGMFLYIPRVKIGEGFSDRDAPEAKGQPVTGFSGDIRLGQLGQILESTDRVLRVGLFDHATDQPASIDEFSAKHGLTAPLFRGSVLDVYQKGRWTFDPRAEVQSKMETWPREPGMIRQEYTLELHGSDVLFAMHTMELAVLNPYQPVNIDPDTDVLFLPEKGRDVVKYVVFSDGTQTNSAPRRAGRSRALPYRDVISSSILARCRKLPRRELEQLRALARDLTAPDKLIGDASVPTDRRIADTLTAHLRDSGRYTYSLNMAVDDPEIDPVEDFLFNRKRGHCEYFASALTLMLRAAKIPSRLITGYKGADRLGSTGQYEVQQRHSHAWVEAFVDGQWTTLDPTPAERDETVRDVAARVGFWKSAGNSVSTLWSTYIVSLSFDRQQQTLYNPLQGSASTGLGSVRGALDRVVAAAGWVKDSLSTPEQLFSPRGAAVGCSLVALPIIGFLLLRRAANALRRPPGRLQRRGWISRVVGRVTARLSGRPPDRARFVVAFYEQFQALVGIAGFFPRIDQTQLEFARQVEQGLAGRKAPAVLLHFPGELAELFYHVRFGDRLMQPVEIAEVEHRLKQLKAFLKA